MFLKAAACYAFLLLIPGFLFPQLPVGAWREHLPYRQAISVVEGMNRVYCATPFSLFSVDLAEGSIERMSKMNGLSETGVSAIGIDKQNNRLVIGYDNSNIDIIDNNQVINIDALQRKDITADKRIYAISCVDNQAYLCTGLGLVVIDLEKREIKDTYVIGNGGVYTKLSGFASDNAYYYAASVEGLKKAPKNGINLADYRNWQLIPDVTGLPSGPCDQVAGIGNSIIVRQADSLFVLKEGRWSRIYKSDWTIIDCNTATGKPVICEQGPGAEARVLVLNIDGEVKLTIRQPGIVEPRQAVLVNDEVWVADAAAGLAHWSANNLKRFQPNSPDSVSTGEMIVAEGSLWVASGVAGPDWSNHFTKNGFYQFLNQEWINYNGSRLMAADSVYDLVSIAIDPVSKDVWAGSYGGGLLQVSAGGQATVYKQQSLIAPDMANPARYRVTGLCFDSENSLWIANYGAAQNLVVRHPDGTSRSFAIPFPHNGNTVSQIVIDDENQKWIISPDGNGLFCFNHGNSLENTGDDRWKFFRSGTGNGNLPDNDVFCLAKDKNGFIWVGTRKGIGIISCMQDVFGVRGCEAVLPVVQQDNFAGHLFRDEAVQAIAVDGADRKWVGTKRGVWLISPDGEKTIYHFTEENSALLHDDVRKIAIDPVSGEVYFATEKGICSFRSTATEAGPSNENLLVFPNPVPPGYTGQIAIRGLVNNALVKITELGGRLVYQTRANGGQAVWNGRDYNGRQVSTGVYLILVTDDTRKENMAGKIVFVR